MPTSFVVPTELVNIVFCNRFMTPRHNIMLIVFTDVAWCSCWLLHTGISASCLDANIICCAHYPLSMYPTACEYIAGCIYRRSLLHLPSMPCWYYFPDPPVFDVDCSILKYLHVRILYVYADMRICAYTNTLYQWMAARTEGGIGGWLAVAFFYQCTIQQIIGQPPPPFPSVNWCSGLFLLRIWRSERVSHSE